MAPIVLILQKRKERIRGHRGEERERREIKSGTTSAEFQVPKWGDIFHLA